MTIPTVSPQRPPRLSVFLDGKPAYLYSFSQGSYEDRVSFVCAHPWELTPAEVRERLMAVLPLLPESIEYDFMTPGRSPDLFEQLIALAGFTVLGEEIFPGVAIPRASSLVTDRDSLERALK